MSAELVTTVVAAIGPTLAGLAAWRSSWKANQGVRNGLVGKVEEIRDLLIDHIRHHDS